MIYRIRLFVLLSFIAIVFAGSGGYSQEAFFRLHPVSDEVNNGNLQTIFQDQQGFIWIGTTTGLYRFDGTNYLLIPSADSLKNASYSSVYQTIDGTIWTGTRSGKIATIVRGKLELFAPEEGNPGSTITSIIQDSSGNIWFSTYGEGVYCFSNHRLYNFNTDDGLSDNYTYSLAADKKGYIWVGTDGGISICKIAQGKKTIENLTSINGLPDNIVLKITMAANDKIWIGMQDGGICSIDIKTRNIETLPQLSNWEYGPVNDLVISGSRLWAGTDDHGIISAELKSLGQVQTYTTVSGVSTLKILKLLGDSEGNIWFLTSNSLIQSPGAKLELLSAEKDKNFANIHSVLCDKKGNIWFSNDNGLFRYHRGTTDISNPEQFLSLKEYKGMKIISLYQDREGDIWIGTFGNGILRLNPETKAIARYSETDGLENGNILSITGVDNEIWLATLGGAFRCILPTAKNAPKTRLKFEEFGETSGLGNNFIYSVFADSKKRIWFATDGKGISVRENGKFRNYSDVSEMKSKVVYSIAEEKTGHIWFSTAKAGLCEFDGKTFRNYTLKDGLSNLAITSIASVKSSKIFIINDKGIDILDPISGKFSYLGSEEGIGNINPDLNAISVDYANDVVWIGTQRGIFKLAADEYSKLSKPQIQLTKVQVFLNETDTLGMHVFPHDQNHFTFDFVGLWYKAPERVNYQVMLKGYDLDWITTKNTSVTFSSLAPGSYTFMVRASVNNDFSDATVKSYYFVIRKAIWRTWWFIAVILLMAIIIVFFFIRSREKRLKREENLQKEKILFQFETLKSQVNPHFLFNSFSTLSAIIDEDKEMALDYVQKLSLFFRNILEYRDKSVITLKEEIELADTYYYLQKKRYGDNFSLKINVPNEFLATLIPPLTLQMILENAVKHNIISAEKPLSISITVNDGFLVISNPVQAKKNAVPSIGIGLPNIRNRYRLLINKEIEIIISESEYKVLLPIIKTPEQ